MKLAITARGGRCYQRPHRREGLATTRQPNRRGIGSVIAYPGKSKFLSVTQ